MNKPRPESASAAESRPVFNALLGREAWVQALKREVNQLLKRQGEPVRYPSEEV